jgi:hypothetical protein
MLHFALKIAAGQPINPVAKTNGVPCIASLLGLTVHP